MYATFLQLTLDKARAPDRTLPTGEAVVRLSRYRARLSSSRVDEGASVLLAEELTYDVALILLARQLEIAVDVQAFDQPRHERSRLERAIEAAGINLLPADASSAGDSGGVRK